MRLIRCDKFSIGVKKSEKKWGNLFLKLPHLFYNALLFCYFISQIWEELIRKSVNDFLAAFFCTSAI